MNQELIAVCLPDKTIILEWQETESIINKDREILQNDLYKKYCENFPSFLFYLGFVNQSTPLSESLHLLREFSFFFRKKLSLTPDLEILRENAFPALEGEEPDEFISKLPFMVGAEYVDKPFFESSWKKLLGYYREKISSFKGSVEDFLKSFNSEIHLAGKVYFHLVESNKEDFPFAFLATYSVRLDEAGKSKHIPLKNALSEFGENSIKLLELLSAVNLAARESKIVSGLIESGEIFHPITLSVKEAYAFLKEIPIYEKYGIICRIPNWWKNKPAQPIIDLKVGNKQPSFLGKDALLDFEVNLHFNNVSLSQEELSKLMNETEGLALIKGKWIEVDHEKLQKTLDAYKKARELMKKQGITLKEAMQLQLNLNKKAGLSYDDELVVSNGEWFKSVIEKLRNPDLIGSFPMPGQFGKILRPYQQKGVRWLCFLHSLQFGACLADDMGLGKTVQFLAFLTAINENQKNTASLLIIPASLISNWENEIQKFSPGIKYFIAHSSFNGNFSLNKNSIDNYDLIITTYGSCQKFEWIKNHRWNYIILDEAQAIKNPGSKQTKAVKNLEANNRIIMTGTPIENRIGDIWSLFDFVNPGMLGNSDEFTRFSKSLKANTIGFSKLRKMTSPYILRRLKTDKSIISDLPDKVEMKTYTDLRNKQIVLYKKLVEEVKRILEEEPADSIKRKGIILASMMKFKQICNHPDQYLGINEYAEADSGKFVRLKEICETIFEKRERVLIFTQFKEITAYLQNFLESIFRHKGLIFHGSIPVKKRKEIAEQFQGKEYVPFIVLSLKAGGTGLNLTAANHVIHFDRWWNPAVENQATDRAFRIGQKKNVIVHKFITKGTLEEKIDLMLTEKGNLSKEIIRASDENWITEMSNEKLMDLLKLTI